MSSILTWVKCGSPAIPCRGASPLNEAISRSWDRLQGAWTTFTAAREALPAGDAGSSLTRGKWLLPLFQELGYGRRHARYRNQYTFLPTIEFEEAPVSEALHMLLRETPMLPDDNIQVVGWDGFRAFLIRDALQQLGEPHHGRLKRLPPILPRLLLKRLSEPIDMQNGGSPLRDQLHGESTNLQIHLPFLVRRLQPFPVTQ